MANRKALPLIVQEALYEALDDEYGAYGVYDAVLGRFGRIRPFTNIIEAEVRHADAIKALMCIYGMSIPENPYLTGVKPLPDVPNSIKEACELGVKAEIENAALYRDKILPAVAGYADITAVMLNLMDASQNNHLPAFERCAAREKSESRGRRGCSQGTGLNRGGQGRGQGRQNRHGI